ncbi:serine dehydratase alpha chain-domain-containing protein [Lanmaoa asiatica]|nr:serine dehydratase alpha chain-domain-containing protein [Lanmaoa asiatica]
MLSFTFRTSVTLAAVAARAIRRDRIRCISRSPVVNSPTNNLPPSQAMDFDLSVETDSVKPGHAVISTFDLFSIGVGPSSSHTVGPMRAGKIFIADLKELGLLDQAFLYPCHTHLPLTSLGFSLPGKGYVVQIQNYIATLSPRSRHHTPQAILLGLEGSDPETIDCGTIPSRYEAILLNKSLHLGGKRPIHFDMDRDMLWRWDRVLKTHPNGMRFSCFGEHGDLLATNEYFSVGGGFVVNEKTKEKGDAIPTQPEANDPGHPPYPFESGNSLLALTKKHNLTIAQIVHDNERYFGLSEQEIHDKVCSSTVSLRVSLKIDDYPWQLIRIWGVMDNCIRAGVTATEKTLPGRLGLQRRAPILYRRLMRGFYPSLGIPTIQRIGPGSTPISPSVIDAPESLDAAASLSQEQQEPVTSQNKQTRTHRVIGSFDHPVLPMPPVSLVCYKSNCTPLIIPGFKRRTMIPAVDFLSCYAIAVNEVNASGGRIVTSPTNGAAGVIPAVLKYIIEFVSDDPEKSVKTFLLTASAIGMLFKRGSTISAAEGGCQAEVGVACSMAGAGFAACMGASPETVLQAAEIGIEHNLGLTCDPIDGLVQVPCIVSNFLVLRAAVKAVTAAQLSMASHGIYRVTLDEAIEAMRVTAADMSVKYKETSLSTTVKIPLTVPAC